MTKHYLLIEGINIDANVFDTNQLSVIRGSSFLLRDAILNLANKFSTQLTPLSLGGSSGFFETTDSNIHSLVTTIQSELETPPCSTVPFIIEHCQAKDPKSAKETLLAQLRIRQLRAATIVPDTPATSNSGASHWHGVRPQGSQDAQVRYAPPDGTEEITLISSSEKQRWDHGRNRERVKGQSYHLDELTQLHETEDCAALKNGSYKELEERLKKYGFCRELGHIADSRQTPENTLEQPIYPKLDGKVAIFYADGNDFGKRQRERLKSDNPAQAQQEFDRGLRCCRSKLLTTLLQDMLDNDALFPDMKTRSLHNVKPGEISSWQKALRLETLLWGGDELMFVMPAWIGFAFVQRFFELTNSWLDINEPLTHSAGLVFCSAKTPIRITRDLARMIADDIKQRTEKNGGKRNAWDYMVLESIDYPTDLDYQRFLHKRYGEQITPYRPICIPGEKSNWTSIYPCITRLIRKVLPTRQLYRLAHTITHNTPETLWGDNVEAPSPWPPPEPDTGTNPPLQIQLEQRLLSVIEDTTRLDDGLDQLAKLFGLKIDRLPQRAWLWLHLVELRDYIAPQRNEPAS